jgi:hypothetical protein
MNFAPFFVHMAVHVVQGNLNDVRVNKERVYVFPCSLPTLTFPVKKCVSHHGLDQVWHINCPVHYTPCRVILYEILATKDFDQFISSSDKNNGPTSCWKLYKFSVLFMCFDHTMVPGFLNIFINIVSKDWSRNMIKSFVRQVLFLFFLLHNQAKHDQDCNCS